MTIIDSPKFSGAPSHRPAGRAIDQIRISNQSEHREGARHRSATDPVGPRRRGDRIGEHVRYWPKAEMSLCAAHVRYWPKADIGACTAHVRFRGKADIFVRKIDTPLDPKIAIQRR